jgi:hypothetical protein
LEERGSVNEEAFFRLLRGSAGWYITGEEEEEEI